jgi:hypothetical protein
VGETITVTGTGFTPNANVHLVLRGGGKTYDLGTFKADGQGSFSAQVKLPAGVLGTHLIVAVSGAPNIQQCPGDPIQIHGPGSTSTPPGGPTSFTGTDIMLILLAAAVLIAAGVIVSRSGKRRHAEHT